jgi:hypothetical protein
MSYLFLVYLLEYSCARVDAVFLPRVGQKSHITGWFGVIVRVIVLLWTVWFCHQRGSDFDFHYH